MQTEVPFTGQPYRVKDNDPKMLETLDSVRQRGVRTPGLVRPDPEGGYEIISAIDAPCQRVGGFGGYARHYP